jgi:hypothetical protein
VQQLANKPVPDSGTCESNTAPCAVRQARPPPDIEMANNFRPVNQANSFGTVSSPYSSRGLNPFKSRNPSRTQLAWLQQNQRLEYQTIYSARTIPKPLEQVAGGRQSVEGFSSFLSCDKGKGKLVEPPPGILKVASPTSEPFQEDIRGSAKSTVELFNIHSANVRRKETTTNAG